MYRVMSIFGTRPEAIKMAPLVKELERRDEVESVLCVTAQHRQMLDQVLDSFALTPDYDLNLMKAGQTLTSITSGVLTGLDEVFNKEKIDLVLVHGDTTTSTAAALAAFYHQIPVGHVEAGLRSFDKYSPFPEEMNRCITGRLADLHFAPTERNRENLRREGVTENVHVVGNTVIDALRQMVREDYAFKSEELQALDFTHHRWIVMTAHRRENLGEPLENLCRAARRIVEKHPDVELVYPVHMNPAIRRTVREILGGVARVHLVEPVEVEDMHNLLLRAYLVMTDSGGLQEEAPALQKPVVVLRTETERPEVVEAGKAVLAGVREEDVYAAVSHLLEDEAAYARMLRADNPYGDGHAAERIADVIVRWLSQRGEAR